MISKCPYCLLYGIVKVGMERVDIYVFLFHDMYERNIHFIINLLNLEKKTMLNCDEVDTCVRHDYVLLRYTGNNFDVNVAHVVAVESQ